MATNDVPGANPANGDELAMGCWAEHDDGSLIFVESTENGRVIYSIFDTQDPNSVIEYRDSMNIRAFEKRFSHGKHWNDDDVWTWHDKTPFPWDRVIAGGARDGQRYAHADDLLSAAERVARSRGMRKGREVDADDYQHLVDRTGSTVVRAIREGLQRAIDQLRS